MIHSMSVVLNCQKYKKYICVSQCNLHLLAELEVATTNYKSPMYNTELIWLGN